MSFLSSFSAMAVLFLVVIIGFAANKFKFLDSEFNRRLSALVLNVTFPFLILSTAMGDVKPNKDDILPVLITGTLTFAVMILLSFPLTKLLRVKGPDIGVYRFMLVFGNINFIGFPVLDSLFGPGAVFYASVLTIPFNFLIFLLGVIFITSGKGKFKFHWHMFFAPNLVATYITISLVYFNIDVPSQIAKACSILGDMTIPASLMIIGSTLAIIPIREMAGTPHLYAMTFIKLLVLPAIFYGLYKLSPLDEKYVNVLVILAGMPVASIGTMLCLKCNVDAKTMSQGTFISTFLSLLSIPILSIML